MTALVATLVACAGTLLSLDSRAAAQAGACTDQHGVTVVVDFQSLGGQTIVACAAGPVSSGFDALDQAGISYQTVTTQPGFICRIQGLPSDQTCADTPPTSAYWSYWYADRGGDWTYARVGAGNRTPPSGSVEGWSFSTDATTRDGMPPRTAPPPPAEAQPTPTPSATTTPTPPALPDPTPTNTGEPTTPGSPPPTANAPGAQPRPDGGQPSTDVGTDADVETAHTAGPEPTTDSTRPTPTASPTPDPTPTATGTPTPDPLATMVAINPGATGPSPVPSLTPGTTGEPLQVGGTSADGPPWQTLVGAALVVTVGGAAGLVALRRRDE